MLSDSKFQKNYSDAKSYYENGQFALARNILSELILQRPFIWQLWFSLGATYQLEKNYTEAIKSYNTAIKLNSENAYIYFHLAETFLSLNDKKNALFALNMAKKKCNDANLKDKIIILIKQNS